MKQITAYIRDNNVENLMMDLADIKGMTGASISREIIGYGRGRGKQGESGATGLMNRARIEVMCSNEMVDTIVSAIEKSCHTGNKGDGKIYAFDIDHAVRISTGERGEAAV